MAPNPTKYHFMAVDCRTCTIVDEVFDTIPDLVNKYGTRFELTARRCESIRRQLPIAFSKYRHIAIREVHVPCMETYKKEKRERDLEKRRVKQNADRLLLRELQKQQNITITA